MTATADVAGRLAETIGPKRVVSAAEELEAYSVDALVPSAIVRPGSPEEAAEVVRFALAEKLAVLPLGSRSKSELGLPPERYDIAVDMTGLHAIAHYDAGDLTLSVDAGMPLRELEMHLKQLGQFLPLAVPCFESATVGGTIASGIDSALRLQYGPARDFLIGAEFVDGTGKLCKSGGRVVKNVTGYDLHKLLIGSLGTLGIITSLNFRTFPLAPASGGHVAGFDNPQTALECRSAIEKAGLPLANLEVLNPRAAAMIRAILQRSGEASPPELEREQWFVYASFEGSKEVVQRIAEELEKIARGTKSKFSRSLENTEEEAFGGMLRESFEWLRWASAANVICRLALPKLSAQILAVLSQMAEEVALNAAFLVRSVGIIYFTALAQDADEMAIAALAKIAVGAKALARREKGHVTLLHAPLAIKQMLATELGAIEIDLAMQQRVKQAFDPSGVFAPGRVVGGI
ncbi:MAG: FAD-binding oxidoreductase [Candidatus Acidiferrum sp.]